jgi:hypothetical protein
MAELQLTLSNEEREYLVRVLESALKSHRIEEHRTRSPSSRETILREEDLIGQVLAKLGQPPK